jgi:hypothetical protein
MKKILLVLVVAMILPLSMFAKDFSGIKGIKAGMSFKDVCKTLKADKIKFKMYDASHKETKNIKIGNLIILSNDIPDDSLNVYFHMLMFFDDNLGVVTIKNTKDNKNFINYLNSNANCTEMADPNKDKQFEKYYKFDNVVVCVSNQLESNAILDYYRNNPICK